MSPSSSSVKKCAPPFGRKRSKFTGAAHGGHHQGHPAAGPQHPHHFGQGRGRIGDQLQDGEGDGRVDGFVAQRKLLCVRTEEADLRPRLGVDRSGQHRLGDVDAQREPVGSRRTGQ